MKPYDSTPPETASDTTALDFPRLGALQAMHRGATRKIHRASYLAGAVAVLFLIPALAITLFGAGSGRGWGVPGFLLPGLGVCITAVAFSGVLGAVFGFFGWLVGRNNPKVRSAPPPPKKRSKIVRWLRVVFAVIAVLLLALSYVAGMIVGDFVDQELARATAVADRDDPYWRIDDVLLHRAPVPDAENSAPVVVKAGAQLPPHMPDGRTRPFEFLKICHERLTAVDDDCRLDIMNEYLLREELKLFSESLRIARSLAGYARGRYELKLGPCVIDTPLPGLISVKDVAWLMAADSAIRAHDRDFDAALDSCRAILAAARSIGDEPTSLSQIVRIAAGTESLKATRRVLGQGEPSDGALARAQELLLNELEEPLALYALRGDRAIYVEVARRLAEGQVTMQELSEDLSKFDPKRPRDRLTPWFKLYLDRQQAVMLQWMNDANKIEHEPSATRAARWSDFQGRFNVPQNSIKFWLTLLPLKVFPALRAMAAAAAQLRADSGATAILIAAERHRKKTGKWPEAIAAIDPSILPKPPADPYTGEAFRMERRDGEFLIYSVGSNQRDDHGEFDKERRYKGGPDDITARGWDVPRRGRPAPEEVGTPEPDDESPPPPQPDPSHS
jgi:hypothetical protein